MIDNKTFLVGLFGADAPFAHITSFTEDPSDIPDNMRMVCWSGNYANRTKLIPDSNQYYTISTFYADQDGTARRRKGLFRCTHVIVADDVKEKLPVDNVLQLPPPTYKLETSPGSEQWGWKLDVPCTDINMVENLLDGLVARGLAPAGKDPGMKGVTRYVRLPEGVNTKANKRLPDGHFPRCKMLEWRPEISVSIQQLAAPFGIDLSAPRRESRVDGASDVPDHPLLGLTDVITIKTVLSDGRFDVVCPWVEEHTNEIDDGAAVFTNADGSVGFKCHHGSCEHRTAKDLLDLIEHNHPGFRDRLKKFQFDQQLDKVIQNASVPPVPQPEPSEVNFLESLSLGKPEAGPQQVPNAPPVTDDPFQTCYDALKQVAPTTQQAIDIAMVLLKNVDTLPHAVRRIWHKRVQDYMSWTNPDLKLILEEGREEWYATTETTSTLPLYEDFTYIISLGQFYDNKKRMFLKPDLFQNAYCHLDEDIRADALLQSRCVKADALDYAPGYPKYFQECGVNYLNTWIDNLDYGTPGDPTPWLDHFAAMGWVGDDREHLIRYMAHTLQRPETKINHGVILGGGEGIGKDFLLMPLKNALGIHTKTILSRDLISEYNDYLLNTKLLIVNELDANNHRDAAMMSNYLKAFVTSPPERIGVNQKYVNRFPIRNIVNVIIGTNEVAPLKLSGDSRRYFVLWSDLSIRDEEGQVLPEWTNYFKGLWAWMYNGGWRYCANYLANYDLTGFDAGEAPRVTEAMKDIQASSQDSIAGLIIACVARRVSMFKSDLLTAQDVHQALTVANATMPGYATKQIPSIITIGKIIKQHNLADCYRSRSHGEETKIYAFRNRKQYKELQPAKVRHWYQEQIQKAKESAHLGLAYSEGESHENSTDRAHSPAM